MPNWCFTQYRFFGKQEDLEKLNSVMDELKQMDEPRIPNGFGNLWLGCIVDYFGGNYDNIYCRGEVTQYELCEDYLNVWTESAWRECAEFRKFLSQVFPDMKIYYISEEPSMEEYYTNDKDYSVFKIEYFLDAWDDVVDPDYFSCIEEVADYLNKYDIEGLDKVEPTEESINATLDKFNDEHEDNNIILHKVQIEED